MDVDGLRFSPPLVFLSETPKFSGVVATNEEDEESKALQALAEAFSLASLDDVVSAYNEANGDPDIAAEILAASLTDSTDYLSASSGLGSSSGTGSSSGWSTSGSSEGFVESGYIQNVLNGKDGFRGTKQKRVIQRDRNSRSDLRS
uniref:At5g58720/SDE5-like UBA-like domain-containing protein n=1 Tax=Fagus sylvatica TaxID=28930 RepID=A0A2N9FQB5_FAGSY